MPARIPRTRPPVFPRSRSTFGFPASRLPDPRNLRASGCSTTPMVVTDGDSHRLAEALAGKGVIPLAT